MKKNYTEKSNLERKLKAYSLAAVSVMAVQPAVGAIVYTNVPDTTLTATGDFFIDLNNDAVDDFALMFANVATARNVRVSPAPGNEVLGSASGQFFYPAALNLNDPVNGNQTQWNGTLNGGYFTLAWLYTTGGTYGNWFGATDKYMGLRFKVGTNWHYGWIRLDVPANVNSLTIKDFAFDNAPNTGILAGATGMAGIQPTMLPDRIQLFAYDRQLTIDLHDVNLTEAAISLTSVNGQQVLDERLNGSKTGISLSNLTRGVYLARITSNEGILTRKIYIE